MRLLDRLSIKSKLIAMLLAVSDVEVMIPDAIVDRTIDRQPSFAREMSQILELRRRAIQSVQVEESPYSD